MVVVAFVGLVPYPRAGEVVEGLDRLEDREFVLVGGEAPCVGGDPGVKAALEEVIAFRESVFGGRREVGAKVVPGLGHPSGFGMLAGAL